MWRDLSRSSAVSHLCREGVLLGYSTTSHHQHLGCELAPRTPLPPLLAGTSLEPLAELHVDTSAKAISVPDALWEQQRLRQCLHDVANSSVNVLEELPPPLDMTDSELPLPYYALALPLPCIGDAYAALLCVELSLELFA